MIPAPRAGLLVADHVAQEPHAGAVRVLFRAESPERFGAVAALRNSALFGLGVAAVVAAGDLLAFGAAFSGLGRLRVECGLSGQVVTLLSLEQVFAFGAECVELGLLLVAEFVGFGQLFHPHGDGFEPCPDFCQCHGDLRLVVSPTECHEKKPATVRR